MLFYYNSKEDLVPQAQNLQNALNIFLDSQNLNLKILLECLKHLNSTIQDTISFDNPTMLIDLLRNIKETLDNTRSTINKLNNLKNILEDIKFRIDNMPTDEDYNSLIPKIENYNKLANTLNYKIDISKTQNLILEYIKNTNFNIVACTKEKNEEISIDISKTNNTPLDPPEEPSSLTDNNTLIISETKNAVFLPYSIAELEQKLNTSTSYKDLQEVIDNEYTIPIDRYKNTTISRFKEAYNLMRKKEHASITDSLDLALELTFNNLLNPAIITACKDLDELDIYLDCLNSNELDKFKIFEIKYEILPTKQIK